jgi:hypothetical protein
MRSPPLLTSQPAEQSKKGKKYWRKSNKKEMFAIPSVA